MRDITPLALAKLANQRRVYDRLDWWPLEAWRTSDALIAIATTPAGAGASPSSTAPSSLAAALLIVPMSISDLPDEDSGAANPVRLNRSTAPAAWVRWCAVAEGQSPSVRLAQLFEEAALRCRSAGITELWCLSEPRGWLALNLRDLGFKRYEELITLTLSASSARRSEHAIRPVSGVILRVLHPSQLTHAELDALQEVDHAAFGSPWHYSKYVLRQALHEARYATVAEKDGRIVGYQCTLVTNDMRSSTPFGYGHVTRLAVHPDLQRRGVGRWLFADALHELFRMGVLEVTLNTLSTNTMAQQFYRRFGFVPLSDRMAVLRSQL